MGKIVPPSLISFFAIQRLLPHPNSPTYWRKNNEDGKIIAYFGSLENFDNLPKKWEDFNLLFENKDSEGNYIDYKALLVIKAGHWCEECMPDYTWSFDILSKKNPFFAQVWYDSHDKDEDMIYYFDENFKAHYKKV